ncbi:hypothetical protein ACLKA7_008047 [Drosophila subpalustris]
MKDYVMQQAASSRHRQGTSQTARNQLARTTMDPHSERMCRHQIILQAEKALDSRLPWRDGACEAVPSMGVGERETAAGNNRITQTTKQPTTGTQHLSQLTNECLMCGLCAVGISHS